MEYAIINDESFVELEIFNTQDEMNQAIYSHVDFLREQIVDQAVIDLLWFLGRHSNGVKGVSYCSRKKIAEHFTCSTRTISRRFRTLIEYGIIDKVATVKGGWQRSVDAVRILPVSSQRVKADKPKKPHEINVPSYKTENEPIISNQLKDSFNTLDNNTDKVENTSVDNIDSIDVEQLQDFIPDVVIESDFVRLAKPYFGTRKILSLSRVLRNGLKRFDLAYHDPFVKEAVESAFKASVWSYKMNRIQGNFASYFYGVLNSELAAAKRKITRDSEKISFFDWIED